jgi:hypothetical protein
MSEKLVLYKQMAYSCKGKKVADLTEYEKWCIAVCAGFKMENTGFDLNGDLHVKTEPFTILENGKGGFTVQRIGGNDDIQNETKNKSA